MLSKRVIFLVLAVPIAYYWLNYIKIGPVYHTEKRLDGKTVLITGGNTGVGKAAAILFAKLGAKVIIASRKLAKSEKAKDDIIKSSENKNVFAMKLDLGDFASIQAFAKEFNEREKSLDYLVNNAALFALRGMTDYGYNKIMAVNHFGPFLLTHLLMDNMKKRAETSPVRIINLSSSAYEFGVFNFDMMHQDSDSTYMDFKIYGQSKLANIYFTSELNKRLKGHDITTYSVHPGAIKSELGENDRMNIPLRIFQFLVFTLIGREPFYGAQTIMYCALDDDVTQLSGQYFAEASHSKLWSYAMDEEISSRLWKETVNVTKKYLPTEL